MDNELYKVYARAENGVVKKVFMDWADMPLPADTLIAETADRHAANDYQIVNEQGIYTKTVQDGKLVDRDISAELEEIALYGLRARRAAECFPIINRGKLWYDSLTASQVSELNTWYHKWLNITDTKTVPNRPSWL